MRRILRITLILLVVLLITAVVTVLILDRMRRHVPDFYEQALEVEPATQVLSGETLEQQAAALASDIAEQDRWEAIFSDEQVNGWLAANLEKRFPKALPPGIKDPRVAIGTGTDHAGTGDTGTVRIACRYEGRRLHAVVNMTADVFLTDEPNVLAVRLRQARIGALPLPLAKVLEQAHKSAAKSGLSVRWLEQDGDPVALVTLPSSAKQSGRNRVLETIDLRDGEVYISGRTEPAP